MKYKGIFWGIVLITIGIMIILRNMNIIHFNWFAFIQLWPLIFIIWGISIIPVKDYIKFILSLLAFIVGILLMNFYQSNNDFCWRWRFHDTKCNNIQQKFEETYDSTTLYATLKLDAAAGSFSIIDPTTKLVSFESNGNNNDYKLQVTKNDSSKVVEIKAKDHVFTINGIDNENGGSAKLLLNPNPIWDIEIDAGASDVNFDFSKFKVRNLDFDGGASDITLKIGDRLSVVNISIDAGVSSIKVMIPQNSACELKGDYVLSDKNIEGFQKSSDEKYRTANFNTSPNKIYITLDAAISSIDIVRY
ncbi:MAG: DUF5668 domain-containing protein [Bacteroidetes bacterium]|nr:DUF5668 domain-containing protein [Bacteroidota bacterium]